MGSLVYLVSVRREGKEKIPDGNISMLTMG